MSAIVNNKFRFWMPAQAVICKGGKNGSDKTGKRWIQGIASTGDLDLQGEIVEQGGIDFDYFLDKGYFNDDHKAGPEHKVGEPVEAKLTKKGLWVKGFLYDNNEKAKDYWGLMRTLAETGSNRRVGFSIQGKVLRRRGTKILKCWIQDVAITTAPVNTSTWAEIAKSLSSMSKSIETEDEEKALSTVSGASIIPESLDQDEKKTAYKSLTFSESVAFLMTAHKLPKYAAEKVAKVVFQSKGVEI